MHAAVNRRLREVYMQLQVRVDIETFDARVARAQIALFETHKQHHGQIEDLHQAFLCCEEKYEGLREAHAKPPARKWSLFVGDAAPFAADTPVSPARKCETVSPVACISPSRKWSLFQSSDAAAAASSMQRANGSSLSSAAANAP